MRRLAALGCLLVAGLASAIPARAAFTDADYWTFADRHMTGLDDRWRLSAVRRVMLGRYRITHVEGPPRARLFTVPAAAEATNPSPAPSLAVQVSGRRSSRLAARIEPTG